MRSSLATRLGGIVASTVALDSGSAGSPPAAAAPLRDAFPAVISEADIRAHVAAYGNRERLTPFRTKQILKKALAEAPPARPGADECCGSACTPCVKDLWKEELACWYEARGLDVLHSADSAAEADQSAGARPFLVAWQYKMVASVQEEHLIPLLLTTDMRTLLPAAIARS